MAALKSRCGVDASVRAEGSMRFPNQLSLLLAALAVAASISASHSAGLERGVAIVDLAALRELDLRQRPFDGLGARNFGLARMLGADAGASNADIFALPAIKPLRAALDREFGDYNANRTSAGRPANLQLFDRDALYSHQTRFILAGIVNRMDRQFISENRHRKFAEQQKCGGGEFHWMRGAFHFDRIIAQVHKSLVHLLRGRARGGAAPFPDF